MDADPSVTNTSTSANAGGARHQTRRGRIIKWGVIVMAALAVAFAPVPNGITPQSWRLLAIFLATIIGSLLRPVPGGAMVLLGVSAIVVTGALPVDQALRG